MVVAIFMACVVLIVSEGVEWASAMIELLVVGALGLLWAASDVVVITRSRIYRGMKSLDVARIQDLVLMPADRLVAPRVERVAE